MRELSSIVLLVNVLGANTLGIASGFMGGNYDKVSKFLKYIIENPDTTYEDKNFVRALRDSFRLTVQLDNRGGSRQIMNLLTSDETPIHIGISQSDIAYTTVYFQKPETQLKVFVIAVLFDEALHIIVPKDIEYRGKPNERYFQTIITLGENSGSYYTVRRIFPAIGASPKFVNVNDLKEFIDSLRSFKGQGAAEKAAALIIAPPWDSLKHRIGDFSLISLTKEEIQTLKQTHAFRFIEKFYITKEHYGSEVEEPVMTVSVPALLVVNREKLMNIFGGSNMYYDKFIRYILTELRKFSEGKIEWNPPDTNLVASTRFLLKDLVDRNIRSTIVANWDNNARDFWREQRKVELLGIIMLVFVISLGIIMFLSSGWKNRVLQWMKLMKKVDEEEYIYSNSAREAKDFISALTLLTAFLFLGVLFVYAGGFVSPPLVKDFIIGGILGFLLAALLVSSFKPERGHLYGFLFLMAVTIVALYLFAYKKVNEPYLLSLLTIVVVGLALLTTKLVKHSGHKIWRIYAVVLAAAAVISSLYILKMPLDMVGLGVGGVVVSSLGVTWAFRKVRQHRSVVWEMALLLIALLIVWVWGGFFLYQIEGALNINFNSYLESMWSVVVYLFSGLEDRGPLTLSGRILSSLVIFFGSITVLSTFTAILSSFFTERKLKEGGLFMEDYKNHIVICNWNSKGEKVLGELLKSPYGKKAERFVILTPEPLPSPEIEHLEKLDEKKRITFLSGNLLAFSTLEAVGIYRAKAVIVLSSEDDETKDPDAQTAMIVLSIRSAINRDRKSKEKPKKIKGQEAEVREAQAEAQQEKPKEIKRQGTGAHKERTHEAEESEEIKRQGTDAHKEGIHEAEKPEEIKRPKIIAEARTHRKMPLIKEAGADIVICIEDFEGGLIVQSANYPGLFDVYKQLLEYSPGTNEFYMMDLKDIAEHNKELFKELLGKKFNEVVNTVHEASPSNNPTIVVGLKRLKNGEEPEIILNPKKEKWGDLKIPENEEEAKKFSLIVMCYTYPEPSKFKVSKGGN